MYKIDYYPVFHYEINQAMLIIHNKIIIEN
jgi:hypothetical protein